MPRFNLTQPIPLLFLGDSADSHGGLGRIGHDLAWLASSMPEFEVGYLGRGSFGSSRFPWTQYAFGASDQWGEAFIERAWTNLSKGRKGIILTVWDASRLLWFADGKDTGLEAFLNSGQFERWGYFMADAAGVSPDTLPLEQAHVVSQYDRAVFASHWAYSLAAAWESMRPPDADWIPHPINREIFHPRGREEIRSAWGVGDETILVGCVMANQQRKSWPVVMEAFNLLTQEYSGRTKLWVHTDKPLAYWNIPALAVEYGVSGLYAMESRGLTDHELAMRYSACDVTLVISGGEGFCFKPGAMVETMLGPVAIENVRVGELVLTHSGRYRAVTQCMKRKFSGPLTIITPACGNTSLYCTGEHPISDGSKFVPASSLRKGDTLFVPRDQASESPCSPATITIDLTALDANLHADADTVWYKMGYRCSGQQLKLPRYVELDAPFSTLLGYYIAEGHVTNASVQFTFHAKETERHAFVVTQLQRLGITAAICKRKDYPGVVISGSSRIIARLFKHLGGSGSHNKHIDPLWFGLDRTRKLALLSGIFGGDGYGGNGRLGLTTVSHQLAHDVRMMLRRLGYVCGVLLSNRTWKEKPRKEYNVQVHGKQARRLSVEIDFPVLDVRVSGRVTPSWKEGEAGFYMPIKAVRKEQYDGQVYNLSVEDDESYTVEGFAVHNCYPVAESLSCGVPCVVGSYGAADELSPWRVPPITTTIETSHNVRRAIYSGSDVYKGLVDALACENALEQSVALVQHLNHKQLGVVWQKWLRKGLL